MTAGPPLTIALLGTVAFEQGTYFRWHHLATCLRARGHDVTVFASDSKPGNGRRREVRGTVPYEITPVVNTKRFFPGCNPLNALWRCFESRRPCDVVHMFQPWLVSAASWWRRTPGLARARFYDWDDLWIRGLTPVDAGRPRQRIERTVIDFVERTLPRQADHVTTCSGFLADAARARGARRVSVVGNGYVPFTVPPRDEARRSLGLRADATYVGFMGRTLDELSWCFDALRAHAAAHPRLRFAICGPQPEVVRSVSGGVEDRVDFLGTLAPERTRTFAAALDIGLLPLADNPFNRSRFPIKGLEYLGAGAPVLYSEVGEIGALGRETRGMVPAGTTPAEWSAAFGRAVGLAAAGMLPRPDLDTLERRWSWQAKCDELEAVYRRELSDPAPRGLAAARF